MPNDFVDPIDLAISAIDFKRFFTNLKKWAWLLILGGGLSATLAYFYCRQLTPIFQATTNILVTRNSQQTIGDLSDSMNFSQLVETYVSMLSLDEFLGIVSQRLNYPVLADNVNVTSLANTQVIQLQVDNADPALAERIADTMVMVLREQNETLQAGRYTEAEKKLELQITDSETKLNIVQAQLDKTKTAALAEQISQSQANMDSTIKAIQVVTPELERLKSMTWVQTRTLFIEKTALLPKQQAVFDELLAARSKLAGQMSTDPLAKPDLQLAAQIQAQITELDAEIEKTRLLIAETQSQLAYLTPLDSEQTFNAVIVEKDNILKTQQSLLTSYQNVYTNLLSTGEVRRTTNEIDNLQQSLDLYQTIYLDLLSDREDIKKQKLQNMPTVEQISPAQAGKIPVSPRTLLTTLLGGLGGLILALSFVILKGMADDSIQNHTEVEKILGTKVIGRILEIKDNTEGQGIYVSRVPRSPTAESFRTLRTNLEFSNKEKPIKSIIVTSAGPEEGKTTVASNLAAILSHSGKKVILVDADLRRPRIHQVTGVSNTLGLSELINANPDYFINDFVQTLDNLPFLRILPSGKLPANPTDLLDSVRMKDLLRTLTDTFDFVVIDCPPMIVADPQILLGLVDAVLLVMVPGKTSKTVLRAVQEQVKHSGVRLLGAVFNRLHKSHQSGYDGYAYYKNPYYTSSDDDLMENGGKKKMFKKGRKSTAGQEEHRQNIVTNSEV